MKTFPIEELIPQRPPFIMVEKLIDSKEGLFTSMFTIQPDNIFVEHNFFQEAGLLENIAQTAAAGAGYTFKVNHEAIKLGFIGAMKNAVIHRLPKVNTIITTQIKILTKVLNVDIVYGEVFDENQELLATCEMKIFLD